MRSDPVLVRVAAVLAAIAVSLPCQQFAVDVDPVGQALAPVDVDRDGLPDLLTHDYDTGLRLYRNRGQGRYEPALVLPVADPSRAVGAADFDGDGDVDLVVLEAPPLGVTTLRVWLLRQTSLVFAPVQIGTVAASAAAYALPVDLDGDGDVDLVAGAVASPVNSHRVFVNNGSGAFADATATWFAGLTIGASPLPTVVDVDGDSRPDLLYSNNVTAIVRNTGSAFVDETATRFAIPVGLRALVVGDVDGDGDDDLVNAVIGAAPALLLNQNGVFTPAPAGTFPALPGTVPRLIDLEGDGDLDLVVLDTPSQPLAIAQNDGTGSFAVAPSQGPFGPATQAFPMFVLDQDGDGDDDLMLEDNDQNLAIDGGVLLVNDGTGRLAPRRSSYGSFEHRGVAADVDGDGDGDLLSTSSTVPEQFRYDQSDRWAAVATNAGAQAKHPGQYGDIDGDGDIDLVNTAVWLNDGTGNFTLDPMSGFGVPLSMSRVLVDIDLDGDLDIVSFRGLPLAPNNMIEIFTNTIVAGAARFTLSQSFTTNYWGELTAEDADGDPWPDLVVAGTTLLNGAGVWRNTGVALTYQVLPAPMRPSRMQFAELSPGGGAPWLVVSGLADGVKVYSQSAGFFLDITAAVLPPGARGPVEIADYDEDGDLDLVGVDLLENDGSGLFSLVPDALPGAPDSLADVDGDGDLDVLLRGGVIWNRERHLRLPLPPHTGRNLRVELGSRPGRAQGDLALLGIAFSSRSVGLPGPLGLLFVDAPLATRFVVFQGAGGLAELDLPVPNQAAFVGVELHFQALHRTPRGLGFGNLAVGTVE
ncbi:MAG: VCBS repeat-containing protein [Planctomycetes bacterium]|nr:VCBS repeat-containing protein [Planctomycetota bacterium]